MLGHFPHSSPTRPPQSADSSSSLVVSKSLRKTKGSKSAQLPRNRDYRNVGISPLPLAGHTLIGGLPGTWGHNLHQKNAPRAASIRLWRRAHSLGVTMKSIFDLDAQFSCPFSLRVLATSLRVVPCQVRTPQLVWCCYCRKIRA